MKRDFPWETAKEPGSRMLSRKQAKDDHMWRLMLAMGKLSKRARAMLPSTASLLFYDPWGPPALGGERAQDGPSLPGRHPIAVPKSATLLTVAIVKARKPWRCVICGDRPAAVPVEVATYRSERGTLRRARTCPDRLACAKRRAHEAPAIGGDHAKDEQL